MVVWDFWSVFQPQCQNKFHKTLGIQHGRKVVYLKQLKGDSISYLPFWEQETYYLAYLAVCSRMPDLNGRDFRVIFGPTSPKCGYSKCGYLSCVWCEIRRTYFTYCTMPGQHNASSSCCHWSAGRWGGFFETKNGETWRVVTNWKYKVGPVISCKWGDITSLLEGHLMAIYRGYTPIYNHHFWVHTYVIEPRPLRDGGKGWSNQGRKSQVFPVVVLYWDVHGS